MKELIDDKGALPLALVALPLILQARAEMIATNSDGGCMDCPKCKQGLRWSKSRRNGHIHAACDTEGCLSWME